MSQEIFYWLIVLFIVATLWYAGRLVDYFLQKDTGALVISNKKPPPGSKIIKQLNLPEGEQSQELGKPQPNLQTESSPKPSKAK
jgi:hypothetical protein